MWLDRSTPDLRRAEAAGLQPICGPWRKPRPGGGSSNVDENLGKLLLNPQTFRHSITTSR